MPLNPYRAVKDSFQQYRGGVVVALYIVGAITALCVVGVIVLSLAQVPVPDTLSVIAVSGMSFLAGSATTAIGKKPPSDPPASA